MVWLLGFGGTMMWKNINIKNIKQTKSVLANEVFFLYPRRSQAALLVSVTKGRNYLVIYASLKCV